MPRGRPPKSLAENFWPKVKKTTYCEIWTGAVDKDGYGQFKTGGKSVKAHRTAWYLYYGEWPDLNLQVCHTCDNPSCVRKDHLFIGTPADNVKDMFQKGRNRDQHGEKNGSVVLIESQVLEIRRRAWAGENQFTLADEFGVSQSTISKIKHDVLWSHI